MKKGTNIRSIERMDEIIEKAGGSVTHRPPNMNFKNLHLSNRRVDAQWAFVHIMRKQN